MKALEKLHKTGVIHNDLKRDNIMIKVKKRMFRKDSFSLKIIDFGYGKFVGGAPHPTAQKEVLLQRCMHKDPDLAMGGPCSTHTDFYSFG